MKHLLWWLTYGQFKPPTGRHASARRTWYYGSCSVCGSRLTTEHFRFNTLERRLRLY